MKDNFLLQHQKAAADGAEQKDWMVVRRKARPEREPQARPARTPDQNGQVDQTLPVADRKADIENETKTAIPQPRTKSVKPARVTPKRPVRRVAAKKPVEAETSQKPLSDAAPSVWEGRQTGDEWSQLRRIELGAQIDGKPVRQGEPQLVEYCRVDPIANGFDLLRTRLVRTIRAYGWKRIAVVSPTRRCGTTFTAANLALSLARVKGSRTVLVDLNQRDPGLADALGVAQANNLDGYLRAETPLEEYFVRVGSTLAIGLADAPAAFAAERLHDPLTAEVLDEMTEVLHPDLVIYDMPAMLAHDDLAAFMPQLDGVLLVTDGTQTTPEHISACERILDGHAPLLGVVLNRAREDVGEGTPV